MSLSTATHGQFSTNYMYMYCEFSMLHHFVTVYDDGGAYGGVDFV